MSYRIEYDKRIGKYEVRKEQPKKMSSLLIMAVVGVIGGLLLWPEAGAALSAAIIPGEDMVTVQSFRNMTAEMRSGASLMDAVYTFCHYVIHGT